MASVKAKRRKKIESNTIEQFNRLEVKGKMSAPNYGMYLGLISLISLILNQIILTERKVVNGVFASVM